MRRVVITGIGAISSLGNDWATVSKNLQKKKNTVKQIEKWKEYQGLNSWLAAPVEDFIVPEHYTRRKTRSMGQVSLYATRATELALIDAGFLNQDGTLQEIITNGRTGVAYGSCFGSVEPTLSIATSVIDKSLRGMTSSSYIHMMSHTTSANISQFFGITGRMIPSSTACTSGSLSIGYAYEAIKYGIQDIMIAGGAEELSVLDVATFDVMFATCYENDREEFHPRPFDKDRKGLVLGEGAGTLVLEEYENAKKRGATIYAEVVGFGTNSDGLHITNPNHFTMQRTLELALKDAEIKPQQIGYVNAHGTATDIGDIAESIATNGALGDKVPVSSLKSYFGHTLGACGVLEAWISIEMMRDGLFAPTINLDEVDSRCAKLDYIMHDMREIKTDYIMTNNFAFGGVNTSLIFKRFI